MKTAMIINAKQFNTVAEYVKAIGMPEFEGEWMDLARFLEVEINPKGGRRSIYNAYKSLNDGIPADTKKSVATTVNVVNTVVAQDVQPEAATVSVVVAEPAKLPKMPKRADYPQTDEGEDDHSAAMTEWVTLKQQIEAAKSVAPEAAPVQPSAPQPKADAQAAPKKVQPQVVPSAPVVDIAQADNIDETALQLAKLLRSIKPEVKTEANPSDIARMIQDAVSEETQDLREDVKVGLMELTTALVELQKQIESGVHTIEVKVNDKAAVKVDGLVHERFEDILRHVSVRDNVMLVGPAGSGKTTVCENVAQALALDFYCKSVCAQTSKAELLGYMDANGNFVSTEFRVAYQNGGVFVLDEIDAGNPNVIAVLNSALANNYCAFADGMIRKHEDFVLIACANTFGTGASREYVGRNQLDSATLDRFSVIEFGYDEKLETALSSDKTFCQFVQATRKELANERVVISPRASIQGGKLLAAGCKPEYVLQTRIVKGMAPALADRVRATFKRFYR